jgi:hypothetical protein
MRIISQFHDYYDGCMAHGFDPKCIYKRDIKEFEGEKVFPAPIFLKDRLQASRPNSWKERRLHWSNKQYHHGMIWFCGHVYPYIELNGPLKSSEVCATHEAIYCYDVNQVEDAIMCYGTKEEKSVFELRGRSFRHRKGRTMKELFQQFFMNNSIPAGFSREEVVSTLCKLGVPCLKLDMPYRPTIIFNPKSTDVQFYRVMNTFTAYQELSMFISGVMGGQAPPMVPISDKVRLEKHGFDEWSFRKKVR